MRVLGFEKDAIERVNILACQSPQEFASLAGKMEDYGACAVELNLSCPHAKGYGMEVGTDPDMVKGIVSAVKDAVNIPVWAKITPNTHILDKIGKAVEDAGGDAIVAINTLKAMVIVPEFGKPLMSNKTCGLSGNRRTILNPDTGCMTIWQWKDCS